MVIHYIKNVLRCGARGIRKHVFSVEEIGSFHQAQKGKADPNLDHILVVNTGTHGIM